MCLPIVDRTSLKIPKKEEKSAHSERRFADGERNGGLAYSSYGIPRTEVVVSKQPKCSKGRVYTKKMIGFFSSVLESIRCVSVKHKDIYHLAFHCGVIDERIVERFIVYRSGEKGLRFPSVKPPFVSRFAQPNHALPMKRVDTRPNCRQYGRNFYAKDEQKILPLQRQPTRYYSRT